MASGDEAIEIDSLERSLLSGGNGDDDDGMILYDASFEEMEDNYVNYHTTRWVIYSLLLVLAWGIGLIMLLYLPIWRFVLRKGFQSRKLYVSSDCIVYKVTKPVIFPCFGIFKRERHVLLPSVVDVVVEQGYLQSFYGIYSVRIVNVGVRRPASDGVKILGVANPRAFRKAVLTLLASMRRESFSQQPYATEGTHSFDSGRPHGALMATRFLRNNGLLPSTSEHILQRLEQVGSSVKRVQALIEKQNQNSESETTM
ncbi:uncharacterized protein LOC120268291 [Dioscorea cayenensis subsp. rotundata]|uniref:Uncharacterized protein LOC120268291 n=1 Tax=Dioscorea cayennensis subsp. rotundata TaxID=55577 RepID=A0AB40BW46_DIOCR|nr:uncharacterized protein LOC120268291 [Dioscorea cayenensis subsp. rotundata]